MADDSEILRYAAFSRDPAAGNPAGVVPDASGLDAAQMQRIAAEVGFSETAFLVPDAADPRHLTVRYFSALAEVPFCGHATIASAVALAERNGPGRLTLHTMAGEVEVSSRYDEDGALVAALTSRGSPGRAAARRRPRRDPRGAAVGRRRPRSAAAPAAGVRRRLAPGDRRGRAGPGWRTWPTTSTGSGG